MNRFSPLQRLLLVPVMWLAIAGSVPAQQEAGVPPHHGRIGLGSWNTTVEFSDIVVSSNGVVLYRSDFAKEGTNGLTILRGNWSVKNGVLRQSAIEPQCRVFLGDMNWANYTVSLRARSTGGQEGFAVYFNALDERTWTWFNFGGWTNTLASIDQQQNGGFWRQLCERRVASALETNVWYDIRVVLNGSRIECFVNSKLVQTATYPTPAPAQTSPPSPSPVEVADIRDTAPAPPPPERSDSPFRFINPTFRGAVGVGTWNTAVEYRNIVVTSNDVVLYRSDFDNESLDSWQLIGGNWILTNGVLRQTEHDLGCFANIGDTNWSNYTLTLQARKISGAEGFCAVVGAFGDNNRVWFNVGSWGNTSVEVYQDTVGRRAAMTERIPLKVETGKWYDVKMEVEGAQVSCYLDSNLIHTVFAHVLVTTNAVYLGSVSTSDGNLLRFKIGKREFRGKLPKERGGPPALEIGSLVEVTGTAQPGLAATDPGGDADFDLLINSPADVVLVQRPSWWTWRRILIFGGAFLGVLIIAAIWIAMISRKNRLLTIAQRELQKANDELELRVRKRTADLAKANAELEHEQSLFRTLLDTASDHIYFKDTASRFVRCSASKCKRSGLTHEEIVSKTDFDIFGKEHARQAFEDEQEIIRTGQPLVGKLEKEVHPDGRTTWVMTTKMPWRGADGEVIGTFGISHDITSIKEAEAELERAQKQLIDASRAAGMAEVATGVLHNVGNVLNSVNVSTALLIQQIRKSKMESVGRVAALMEEHATDLGHFISEDPQGRRVPRFLADLAEQLKREQTTALEELVGLQKNVDHINEIVAMQQSYATVSGVSTMVKITELLDDALRLTESSLNQHDIRLVREFDPHLPEVTLDHHKVLQILVNLLRNAKQACQDSPQPDKQLTLRATAHGGWITISVIDNGVGIPAENLTRIFGHGFTTRKGGHGFGLHSSALAAREIGGNLFAQSEGPGKGAAFILELSLDPEAGGRLRGTRDQQLCATVTSGNHLAVLAAAEDH